MNKINISLLTASVAIGCLQMVPVNAADIRFSGFFNGIANKHDGDKLLYIESVKDSWDFNNTNLGLNILSKVDDNITVAAQLLGGGHESDSVGLDWAFAIYAINDNSQIKVGKIKYAGNLYSETVDVGYTYPWIHAPESIYSNQAELFFEAYKGAAYKYTTGEDTEFTIEAYYGAIGDEEENSIIEGHKRMTGAVVSAENDTGLVKLSYNSSVLTSQDVSGNLIPGVNGKTNTIIALGAEAGFGDAHFYAEIAQRELEDDSTQDGQGWYITATYDIGKYKPVFTIQEFTRDGNDVQTGLSFGLNRQIGISAVLKFEYSIIDDITNNGFFEPLYNGAPNIVNGSSINAFNVAFSLVF